MKGQYHQQDDGRELVLRLNRGEVERLVNEELHRTALSVGALVVGELIEQEVQQICGARRRRSVNRKGHRYGSEPGFVVLGGQKVRIERPRVRSVDGRQEVELAIYHRLQQLETVDGAVMRRLMRGASCRSYSGVVETICESVGLSRSSVSRSFKRQSERRVREFFGRRFEGLRILAIFIDGVQFKGQTLVVAIGVTDDGSKIVLSVRQGATENAQVCTDMLEELRERGVATDKPTLFVLDGSKALRAAVNRVWGENAIVQRCRLHKTRNLRGYVPDKLWPEVLQMLRKAYAERTATVAKKRLSTLAKWLDRVAPQAARSLREGLDETLTILTLGLPPKLVRSLLTTNPIESPFERVRSITRRVTHWTRDMRLRWAISGLVEAESRFIRISGASEISKLARALDRHRSVIQEKIA
jgi:putative transposase